MSKSLHPTVFNNALAIRAAASILNGHPVAASYFITNRCNYKCEFCDYPEFNNDKRRELSVDEIDAMCRKLADSGVAMLSVIGGEPLVRKDLMEVLRRITKHLLTQVTTNGWFVDAEKAAEIFAAGVFQVNVSLDSIDPEVHNTGRVNNRAYERAIAAIKHLRAAPKIADDQTVCIESILSGRNFEQAEEMLLLAEDLGVKLVFQPFSAGHIEGSIGDMSLAGRDVSGHLMELKDKHRALYNNRRMIEKLTSFFRDGGVPNCLAGKTIFNIDSYGNITRCEEQRKTFGNLKELSTAQIRQALAQIQRDTKADLCDTCYLRTRGESEPLYQDDFEHFLDAVQELFGVQLPPVLPKLARIPGMKAAVRTGLGGFLRLQRSGLFGGGTAIGST